MSHAYMSSGARPTVICGQTVSNTAAGAVVTDATRGAAVTVTNQTAGGVVLRLSDSCTYGATITITPSAAMRIIAEAHARDDRLAAAVLRPIAATADVVVAHPDGTSTMVHSPDAVTQARVDLAQLTAVCDFRSSAGPHL
jgi:hypothetical protein